ncbi:MAG: InlB B-repeat-containing protein, partial [Clostridia bacterium]|nr:InlB B-repeat-containing protein [Clostridia bacterium]
MNVRKIICVLLLAALALCTAVPALAVSETDTPVQTAYTVAYDAAGGMRVPEAQTKQHGVDLVLDDLWPVHPNGYIFNYYRSAQGETYSPGGVFSPDSDTTLTASWDDGLYQIVYDANGGTGAPFVQTQFMGESVTLRTDTPTREGYEFLGWSRSSSAKTAEFRPGGTYTHDGGCGILYAVWTLPEQRTYIVTYHPNGGYDEPSPQTKQHGVDLTLSKYAAVRPGFEFAGWATEQGGKAVYQKSSVYTLDADITLYAVWADVLEITSQPADTSVYEGELVSVSVAASGEGLSYQWYVAMAGSDTFSKSSVKKSTYSTVMDESRDGRRVYCIVTDEHGCTVMSDTVTIGMKTSLAITGQPENASAASGKRVEVSVTAAGDGLTYQWYVAVTSADNFIKSSITKSTYGTTMDESRSGRRIYCVVTDAYGNSVRSDTVTISMKSTVAVTKQPVSASAAEGERVNVTVTAAGEGLTYQWYVAMAGSDSFSKSSV